MVILVKCLMMMLVLNAVNSPNTETLLLSFDVETPDTAQEVNDLLDILQRHDAKATFFIEGQLAQREPALIKRIITDGHEVGCHTMHHPKLPFLTKEAQRYEISSCKTLLENQGATVTGFRAPYHLADHRTLRILVQEGFDYDASGFRFRYHALRLPHIRISTFFGFPLEDYTLLHTVRLSPQTFFWLLKHHVGHYHSFNFHPHHIMKHPNELEHLIEQYEEKGARIITHAAYLASSP